MRRESRGYPSSENQIKYNEIQMSLPYSTMTNPYDTTVGVIINMIINNKINLQVDYQQRTLYHDKDSP